MPSAWLAFLCLGGKGEGEGDPWPASVAPWHRGSVGAWPAKRGGKRGEGLPGRAYQPRGYEGDILRAVNVISRHSKNSGGVNIPLFRG